MHLVRGRVKVRIKGGGDERRHIGEVWTENEDTVTGEQ